MKFFTLKASQEHQKILKLQQNFHLHVKPQGKHVFFNEGELSEEDPSLEHHSPEGLASSTFSELKNLTEILTLHKHMLKEKPKLTPSSGGNPSFAWRNERKR